MAKRRLGRGLGALLGQTNLEESVVLQGADLCHVAVRDIDPNPYQPREDFDVEEMAALVQSVQQHGVLQPIVVRPAGNRFQLVAGERRMRAALEAGLETLPARVLDLDEQRIYEIALVENLQRQDLNPLEKARAFQEYLQTFNMTQEGLSKALGVSRSAIANLVRLLELPEEVQAALRNGGLSAGHARALLPLGEESDQVAVARRIQSEGLSVRDVEALVSQAVRDDRLDEAHGLPPAGAKFTKTPPKRSAHLAALEDQLRAALGTKIEIKVRAKDRGQIVIHFGSHDEFERLMAELCPTTLRSIAAGS